MRGCCSATAALGSATVFTAKHTYQLLGVYDGDTTCTHCVISFQGVRCYAYRLLTTDLNVVVASNCLAEIAGRQEEECACVSVPFFAIRYMNACTVIIQATSRIIFFAACGALELCFFAIRCMLACSAFIHATSRIIIFCRMWCTGSVAFFCHPVHTCLQCVHTGHCSSHNFCRMWCTGRVAFFCHPMHACLQRECVLKLCSGAAARAGVLHPYRIISVRFKNSVRQTSNIHSRRTEFRPLT